MKTMSNQGNKGLGGDNKSTRGETGKTQIQT